MINDQFLVLKQKIQLVIDLIAEKNLKDATSHLNHSAELLDEILDFATSDEDIIEVSRFQTLINQLRHRIATS